nr:hypothetical protein [uncultured Psychroserpens sp.]
MKKLLILSVACFLFAGSQLSFAQTKTKTPVVSSSATIQNSPKEKTMQIVNMLERTNKLNEGQKKDVYQIYFSLERKMKGVDAIKDASEKNAKRAKMNDYINSKLKDVLNEEQYKIYLKNTVAK